MIFSPIGLIMVVPVDPHGKTLAWGISEQLEEKGRDTWREYEVSGEAARDAESNYSNITSEPIGSLLDIVEDTDVRLWAPYSIPDLPSWHLGRVCLMGDAAHALPPNGQGSAQAFEDTAIMSRLLSSESTGSYGGLFATFERLRRPRIEQVRELSKMGGRWDEVVESESLGVVGQKVINMGVFRFQSVRGEGYKDHVV